MNGEWRIENSELRKDCEIGQPDLRDSPIFENRSSSYNVLGMPEKEGGAMYDFTGHA